MNKAEKEQYEKLICEYIEANQDAPSRAIARKLTIDYPLMFPNLEGARLMIRRKRGSTGEKEANHRKNSGKKIYKNPEKTLYIYPEPELDELQPYIIPMAYNRMGWISDQHYPKNCNKTIETAYNDFEDKGVNLIILGGDLMDMADYGKFPVKPHARGDIERWFNKAERYLEMTRERFPNALIIFLEGNHDAWYKKWLWRQAKQLAGDPYYSLEERLHLSDYKITFCPEIQLVKYADYNLFHGHQLLKGGALDTVSKRLNAKINSNAICGHMHYSGMFSNTDIDGNITTTIHVAGASSTQNPSYMPFGGKSRKGYITAEIIDNKLEVTNIWLNGSKKVIINS